MVGVVMVAVGLYGGFRATRERRRRAKESKDAGHAHHDHSHCHAQYGEIQNSRDAVLALGVGVVHGLTHIVWVLPGLQMPRLRDASAYLLGVSWICSTGLMGLFAALLGRRDAAYALETRHLCLRNRVFGYYRWPWGFREEWLALLATGRAARRLGLRGPRPRPRPRPRRYLHGEGGVVGGATRRQLPAPRRPDGGGDSLFRQHLPILYRGEMDVPSGGSPATAPRRRRQARTLHARSPSSENMLDR